MRAKPTVAVYRFGLAVFLSLCVLSVISYAQGNTRKLPTPVFDSGWVAVPSEEQSGEVTLSIPHPLGVDVYSSLITAQRRSPASPSYPAVSWTEWTANETAIVVNRALFSATEVRIRIWIHQ